MMAIQAMPLVAVGGWQGLVVPSSGLRMGRSSVRGRGCSSLELGTWRFGVGERLASVASSASGRAALNPLSSENIAIRSGNTELELEQHRTKPNKAGDSQISQRGASTGLSLTRDCWKAEYEASQETKPISTPLHEVSRKLFHALSLGELQGEQSGSWNGRRAFSSTCLAGLVALAFAGPMCEAQAAETLPKTKVKGKAPSSPFDDNRLLEQNRRMQKLNNAPTEFPGFIREGFQVKVVTNDKYVKSKSGLLYYDMVVGQGDLPQDGQQVIFHYTGYNESGRRVDSSYQQGRPSRTRLGIKGMIPGFEEGIKSMRAGGRRIIIIPPELGPPVGPSTFFSAKQFEVFDVELLEAKDCSRRTLLFYSDVVCD